MSNELRVGIMFFTGLALLVLLIWALTRWGKFGSSYTFTIVFKQASGIQTGADVRVSGVTVGQVSEIGLDPATNQALVTVRVKERVILRTGYSYTIGVGGLVGEKYIDIRPTQADGRQVMPGDRITGNTAADINDLISSANVVVSKLAVTADSLNAMVGNKETQRNLQQAIADLRKTTTASAQFAQSMNTLVKRNEKSVDLIVDDLQSVAGDIRRVSDQLTPQLANTRFFANIELASKNAVSITGRLEDITKTAETLFNDKTIGANLREAVVNLKQSSIDLEKMMADAQKAVAPFPQVTANLQKASADLPAITAPFKEIAPETAANILKISQNLRKASETVGGVIQQVTTLGASLASINIEPEARLTFLPSGTEQARSDFNVDLRLQSSMFRLGVTDIGNTSKLNAQFGNRFNDDLWFRYGIVQSSFGAAADYRPNDRWRLTGELFDPSQLRANFLVDYRFTPLGRGWWLNAGWYDAFKQGKWGVGMTYRPNSP